MPQVIDDHAPLAVDAPQGLVVLPLDARLADDVALLVLGELRHVEFLLADFTGVADDVRRHAVLRIEPLLRAEHFHLGKEFRIAMRFDKRQFGRASTLP